MVYYIIATLIVAFLYRMLGYKYNRTFCIIAAAIFGFLAFHMVVYESSDLYRHISRISLYRTMNFNESMKIVFANNNPISHVVFFLFSRLLDNRWYTASIVFLSYYLIFRLINNISEDLVVHKSIPFFCIIFVLTNFNFYMLANCIRMWFSFAIFFYFLYEESVRKRNKIISWIIYVLLTFFHYGVLIMVLCRIIGSIFINYKQKGKGLYLSFFSIIVLIALTLFIEQTQLGELISTKTVSYNLYTVRGTWQTISGWFKLLAVIAPILIMPEIRKSIMNMPCIVLIGLFIVNIIQVNNFTMVLRFGDAFVIASSFMIISYYSIKKRKISMRSVRIPELFFALGSLLNFCMILVLCYGKYLSFIW